MNIQLNLLIKGNKMNKLILTIALAPLFSLQAGAANSNNPNNLVGSTLNLSAAIELAPNKVDAYFQHGKRVSESNVDEYYPNCNIEKLTISQNSQTIMPDAFSINQVIEDEVYPFSGETAQPHETIISISSAKQPDIAKITCSQWGSEISDGNGFVTTEEIKEALGNKFSLN